MADFKRISGSKNRFVLLLGLIGGLHIISPIIKQFTTIQIVMDIFLTLIAIAVLQSISSQKRSVYLAFFLSMIMVVCIWGQYFYPNGLTAILGMVSGFLFAGVVIKNIVVFIISSDRISKEVISAAILVYLVAALMWAFGYTLIAKLDPSAFLMSQSHGGVDLADFQYFSLVTITTLGFGDIIPVSEVAKAFTVFEAVSGQLYLVVVVAWLVGMHVSGKTGTQKIKIPNDIEDTIKKGDIK
jgi:voltage-gated potassium channel